MNSDVYIAPSILSADLSRLGDQIAAVEEGGADWIHVDVMDGHFVPNLTFGAQIVAALKKLTDLPLDVHLMVERPAEGAAQDLIRVGTHDPPRGYPTRPATPRADSRVWFEGRFGVESRHSARVR